MKVEYKNAWMTALYDGSHKQGRGKLVELVVNEEFFCCLGVLCDVVPKVAYACETNWRTRHALDVRAIAVAGISDEQHRHLINLNDGWAPGISRSSFPQIADWIGENIETTE